MLRSHTGFGGDWFPELHWSPPEDVKEYVLVVEDPDIPLPFVATHGVFHSIPSYVDMITASDVQYIKGEEKRKALVGPLKPGKTTLGTLYSGPRPPVGHGPHRYFFQLVALNEPLDKALLGDFPTLTIIKRAIKDKVAGWGVWVGVWENKWE
ncbi:hypothetical protein D6D17_09511 [Aureobasidium pullulans]|nr:hypothetical protein D6D17_09511 [Aureobasidium pullulans]